MIRRGGKMIEADGAVASGDSGDDIHPDISCCRSNDVTKEEVCMH